MIIWIYIINSFGPSSSFGERVLLMMETVNPESVLCPLVASDDGERGMCRDMQKFVPGSERIVTGGTGAA